VPTVREASPVPARKYTVRLHFAETGANIEPRPAFDVELQGKIVLDGQSLMKEAAVERTDSSPHSRAAVVKEYTGVAGGGGEASRQPAGENVRTPEALNV
jgi:hypothetical protein